MGRVNLSSIEYRGGRCKVFVVGIVGSEGEKELCDIWNSAERAIDTFSYKPSFWESVDGDCGNEL